jgi:hypothetical protein
MTGEEFEIFLAAVKRAGGKVVVTATIPNPDLRVQVKKEMADIETVLIEVLTPENVALGHTWLKRKVKEALSE